MNTRKSKTPIFAASVLCLCLQVVGADDRQFAAEDLEFFDIEVLPVLKERCFNCHGGGEKLKSHFRITTRTGLIKGGDRGPAIDLAEPTKSLILAMISYKDVEHSMPPTGKLDPTEAAIITRWVERGVPFNPKAEIHAAEATLDAFDPTTVSDRTKSYWAFRRVSTSGVPEVDDPDWQKNPVDAFIYKRLADSGLRPNPPASKEALIRRAYYDLVGLAPRLDEVRAFLDDDASNAFEKVVDRLLDSPHYGEKWARHWLDVVRFAESNGYERDGTKQLAWGYRDYVIRSFNDDKPYDQFLTEQLAGDELEELTHESLAATGYYRLGLWQDEPVDREHARYEYLDDIARTTGEAMLALTIGCARCHDHKIDPIPQKDYYRFLAFLANISPHGAKDEILVEVPDPDAERKLAEAIRAKEKSEVRLHAEIFEIGQAFLGAAAKSKPDLLKDVGGGADIVELRYRFYRNTFESIPDFDALRAESTGSIAGGRFTLAPVLSHDAVGLVFEGKLRVPSNGSYSFRVRAKDGSRLRVGGELIGEHAGRGEHRYEKSLVLSAGYLPIRFDYFNAQGQPLLEVSWGPGLDGGGSRRLSHDSTTLSGPLVADARDDQPAPWRYAVTKPPDGWAQLNFEDKTWKAGLGGFGSGKTPGSIVRTAWSTEEIWLRQTFNLLGAVDQRVTLSVHHHGDATILLNGNVIKTLGGGRKNYVSFELDDKTTSLLRQGKNVIAVRSRQTDAARSIDVGIQRGKRSENLSSLVAAHGTEFLGPDKRDRYFAAKVELALSLKSEVRVELQKVMGVGERGRHEMHVLLRGNPQLKDEKVEPGFPSVLSPPEPKIVDRGASSGRRRALAEWITSPDNPLTARVMANRLWQFHFGRGIVRSSNNFGRLGDRPTHPELLDWLAGAFRRREWSMKAMHRLIMSSRSYQMSSRGQLEAPETDPQNDLFWRFDMRRLSAEEIRDSMLAAAGRLNPKMYGPSMYPKIPAAILAGASTGKDKWGESTIEERNRRSIYIFTFRSLQDPMLKAFDLADTDASCAVRFSTTVPTQALTMLNSTFVNDQAAALSERLLSESTEILQCVRRGLEVVLSRHATDTEIDEGAALVREFKSEFGLEESVALERYCLLLLNLNEFLYLD